MSQYLERLVKASASTCLTCGQRRGEVRQALIGQSGGGKRIWICVACAEVAVNRRTFIDRYATWMGLALPAEIEERG